MTPHFTRSELQCKCGCELAQFHPGFLAALESLRVAYGRPMAISSACRCAAHNARVSELAPKRSLHIGDLETRPGHRGTLAVDVAVSGADKGALFALAWRYGWSIGWHKTFLHLDRRVDIGAPQATFEY
ncbi:MAG: peptidase M15 [Rhodocyclaceae bacterium]|nr:peptidase M15 [Rhodocyclaceae bacterium]MCA3848772.1 peptidase M15 [Burkholderia sp.]